MQPQQQGGQEMKYEDAGPRMVITPDRNILFFDENGNIIPVKKMKRKELEELINNNAPLSTHKITVYNFGPGSDCRIVIKTEWGDFCFWVDCETGQFLRLC
jgi:hypothetical protein